MCDVDDGGCRYCTYAPCCDKGRSLARTHTGMSRLSGSVHDNDMLMTGFRLN